MPPAELSLCAEQRRFDSGKYNFNIYTWLHDHSLAFLLSLKAYDLKGILTP